LTIKLTIKMPMTKARRCDTSHRFFIELPRLAHFFVKPAVLPRRTTEYASVRSSVFLELRSNAEVLFIFFNVVLLRYAATEGRGRIELM